MLVQIIRPVTVDPLFDTIEVVTKECRQFLLWDLFPFFNNPLCLTFVQISHFAQMISFQQIVRIQGLASGILRVEELERL